MEKDNSVLDEEEETSSFQLSDILSSLQGNPLMSILQDTSILAPRKKKTGYYFLGAVLFYVALFATVTLAIALGIGVAHLFTWI